MSSKNKASAESISEPTTVPEGLPQVPEGYAEAVDDIRGFWDPDLHKMLHITILNAKVFDGNLDPTKVATLLFCRLESPAKLRSKDDHGNEIEVMGEKGDIVGIWGKPGLRNKVLNLAGVDMFICENGTKDIGKPQPMQLYRVNYNTKSKNKGKKIPLTDDTRDKSRHADTWWSKEVDDTEEAPF